MATLNYHMCTRHASWHSSRRRGIVRCCRPSTVETTSISTNMVQVAVFSAHCLWLGSSTMLGT